MHFSKKILQLPLWLWQIAAALLSTLPIAWYFQGVPPISDAGTFAAVGNAINHGQVLYRDVFDNKAPGVFIFNAGFMAIFGKIYGPLVLRILFIFILNLSVLILLGKTRKHLISTALFLVLFWKLVSAWEIFESGQYTEFYGSTCVLLAMAILSLKWSSTIAKYTLVGGVLGIAILFKEPFILPVFAVLLYSVIRINSIKKSLFLFVGLCIPFVFLVSYFLANDSMQYYLQYYKFARSYSGGFSLQSFVGNLKIVWQFMDEKAPWTVVIGLLGLLVMLDFKKRNAYFFNEIIAMLLIVASFIFIAFRTALYYHYFIPTVIFFLLFACDGLNYILFEFPNKFQNKKWSLGVQWFLFIACLLFLQKPWTMASKHFMVGQYNAKIPWNSEIIVFRQKIKPSESLYVDHESMGRFYTYTNAYRPAKILCPHHIYFGFETPDSTQKRNRDIVIAEFISMPPDVVLGRKPFRPGFAYTPAANWVENHYQITDSMMTFEGEWIYIRRRITDK